MNTAVLYGNRLHRSTPLLLVAACLLGSLSVHGEQRNRRELSFPDLSELITLRCDFHQHTVFSDGEVWPTVRVEEAWRNGLDAIAISDHIEYLPHHADIPTNFGRSFQLARAAAAPLGIIVIQAAEITRGEPPGHLNALFLTNIPALDVQDYHVAVSNAFQQGAFLFWNHPGWKQPDGKAVWYAEQGEFLANGWLHGLEIVNGRDYDPIVHGWAVEKKLAIVGNTDEHGPMAFDYDQTPAGMQPLTLVFAEARTAKAIREALFARRTAVFSRNQLFGESQFLEPLFQRSIEIVNPEIRIRGKGATLIQIRNKSPMDFELRLNPKLPELDVPTKFTLPAGRVAILEGKCISDRVTGQQQIFLPCRVTNLLVEPGKPLRTSLHLSIRYGE
jgi:3',5'-nucleoside bisphosphate phosphatase